MSASAASPSGDFNASNVAAFLNESWTREHQLVVSGEAEKHGVPKPVVYQAVEKAWSGRNPNLTQKQNAMANGGNFLTEVRKQLDSTTSESQK
ncbi:hypothetical protein H4R34_001051 [Dimargaris verticillata]|uniref:Uncharacterized protein n=1 Tax=Dimargaris verticillata TaxID=2761393 RepID=A0A9W8EBA7_9FUNG|nr:hypothetical protein H4R34_001051 [Dimargaris verticillata]